MNWARKLFQELDDEFAVIDLVADVVDAAEMARELGPHQVRRVVGAHFLDAVDRFADPLGDAAHRAHPLLAEGVHLALQPGNDEPLDREHRDRRNAHVDILHHDEGEEGDEHARLEHRLGDRVADEAAQRLHLLRDHRNDLALGDALEVRLREAQHAAVEHVAQPSQHALAEPALGDVDVVFERAVDQHDHQEAQAHQDQVRDLFELDAEEFLRKIRNLAADRIVDDALHQVGLQVDEREGGACDRQQKELLRLAVAGR